MFLAGVLLLSSNAPALAQNSSQYRVISQRNIFNQHRVPASRASAPPPVRTVPRTTTDAFSLVGTLVYEKGSFAFFDGTNPDYRKVVEPAGTVAGYKVAAILPNSVQLESGGKRFEMKVGTQLRRHGDLAELASGTVTSTNAATSVTAMPMTPSPTAPPSAAPAAGGNPSDVLRKLMEKRAQEMR